MHLKLFTLFILLSLTFSQSVDFPYEDLACVLNSSTTKITRGSIAYLCVHFITYDTASQAFVPLRAAFPLVVDDFTSVQVTGGQGNFTAQGNFSQIVVQAHGNVSSSPLTYFQMANAFYSSAFSVVIQLDLGNITSVIWDHQCATCGYSECYAFSNSSNNNIDSICNTPSCATTKDSSTCDPEIFVTWIGSDVNNVKMTSAGMRLSRFRQFSTTDLIAATTIPNFSEPKPSSSSNSSSSTNSSSGSNSGSSSNNNTNNNTTGDQSDSGNQNEQQGNGNGNGNGEQTSEGNGQQSSGNGEQTSTGNGQSTGNGEQTSTGNGEQTSSGNGQSTGNGEQTSTGNGEQTGTGSQTGSQNSGNGGTDESDGQGSNPSQINT